MICINGGVVDNNEHAHHDDDPGAYLFPFGQYAGKRLDTVPSGLRWWTTRAPQLANKSWYAAYIKANKRYEELLLQTPEAYPFPFGEHKDKRLDEVPEDLIWWSVHPLRSGNAWYQNLAKANRLYLDKVYDKKSPGSITIWFGERYIGWRLEDVYKCYGFIRFCLKPEHNKYPWYYRFKDLVERYKMHQLSQSFSALSLSQESAANPSNNGELPHAPRRPPRLQERSVRCESDSDDSDTALVQSDFEDL